LTHSKKTKTFGVGEMNTTSKVTQIPFDLELDEKIDYLETKTMYEKFWTECQECFVFEVDTKYTISIEQLERVPTDWTIQEYEEQGMHSTKYSW
jgi:hypothetical protein